MQVGYFGRGSRASTGSLSVILFLIIALLSGIPLVREWQIRLADTFFRVAPAPHPPSPILIVSIDDQSLQQYGRWPWPRDLLAKLINQLSDAGARVIGLDVLLSEPQSPEADLALATSFRRSRRVVLVDKIATFPDGSRWVEPLPAFSQVTAVGHAQAVLDIDSICRRFPALELTLDGPRWAFAVEMAQQIDPHAASAFLSGYGVPDSGASSAVSIARPVLVPIAFRHDGFDTISASQVLSGLDPARVRGRPVLVGFGSVEIGDRLSTPLSGELPVPGITVHAQILDSILTGRTLRYTPLWMTALILLVTCVAVTALFRRVHGLIWIGLVLLLLCVGIYGVCLAALVATWRLLPAGPMVMAAVMAPSLVSTAEYVMVERSLTRQLRNLRAWLSVRQRETPAREKSDLSWRLDLLQKLQTELGSLYELHHAWLESTQDLVATFDKSGNMLLRNKSFAAALGLKEETAVTLEQLRAKLLPSLDSPPVTTGHIEEREVYLGDQLYALRVAPLPATTISPEGGSIVTLTSLRTRVERDRARAEALGFITHELRTPLASIHGFAEMMMRDPHTATAEGAGEIIFQETKRLLALISGYLDVLRLDAGAKALSTHIIDVEALIFQVFDILRPLASSAGMTLVSNVPSPVTLPGDAPLITGAVMNLVSNAIKYGKPGTEIRVFCGKNHREAIIGVQNLGHAIPAEEIPRLFDTYYRATAVESGKTGWGLGLAFVKRIAEKHGGSVEVSSQPAGTVFEIHLPCETQDEATIHAGGTV
jgi:CHASE2 domain-containing sensor protein/signal transduction histidine kinase